LVDEGGELSDGSMVVEELEGVVLEVEVVVSRGIVGWERIEVLISLKSEAILL